MNLPLWFSNLLFWSAQVAVLVLVAGFLPKAFKIRQPRVLLIYWRALLLISLALPLLQPWHRPPAIGSLALSPDIPVSVVAVSAPTVTHSQFPGVQIIAEMIGLIILVGIAARFLMLAFGLLKLRQFRLASSSAPSIGESAAVLDEMRALVSTRAEFRISVDVDSPVTFGFVSPVILLPERFSSMDTRFQAAIACHELLHVRRHDWAQHLFEEILRAIFWFHPAIAWLIARSRLAREQVVDLEVVQLTNGRKPYLEALLECASGRAHAAAILAPPFLVERQLAERVALMLKEVRMSRTRLIVSLTAIACCLAVAATLVVWAFPLKAAPRASQNPPQNGVKGGVSGGVAGGVHGGVSGGVSNGVAGGVSSSTSRDIPTVAYDAIWTDTVKRGPMVRQVRGLGTLVRAEDSGDFIARITLPEFMTKDVRPNQNATIDFRPNQNATVDLPKRQISGWVIRVAPSGQTPTVDIALKASREYGFSAGLQIDATIDIEKLDNILQIGRPVHVAANSTSSVFKIVKDGTEGERVNVKFGRASVSTIEILDGLKEGDKLILSDMSAYDNADRIRLK
jgi:beta-lactamase regulating signal transducer with metallopeptidase domain